MYNEAPPIIKDKRKRLISVASPAGFSPPQNLSTNNQGMQSNGRGKAAYSGCYMMPSPSGII